MKQIYKLGFTGSRNGLSIAQKKFLTEYIKNHDIDEAAHGDCVGADAEFHDLLKKHKPTCKISVFPSIYGKWRAYRDGDYTHEPLAAKDRDFLIVEFANIFIGCPPTDFEILHSGSWVTIRMAQKRVNKNFISKLYVAYPTIGICDNNWKRFELEKQRENNA